MGLRQLGVPHRPWDVVDAGDERNGVEGVIIEREMGEVFDHVLIRQAIVPKIVYPLAVAVQVFGDEQIGFSPPDVEALPAHPPGNVVEPLGPE